jgi:hypothetical protein
MAAPNKPANTCGARNGNARLTVDGVRTIRRLKRAGVTQAVLAEAFRMSGACICLVVTRKRWRHVR